MLGQIFASSWSKNKRWEVGPEKTNRPDRKMEKEDEKNRKRKIKSLISGQMLLFEFRSIMGNPYVHIFGMGMPVMMVIVICRVATSQIPDEAMLAEAITAIFLGIGTLIPMATVLVGYGVARARDLERGIPLRMELFGIRTGVTLCNNALAELVYMLIAFGIYFAVGFGVLGVEQPQIRGIISYLGCILALSAIMFSLAYAISSFLKKFGSTYCVTMFLYFGLMIFGGMMGITYDNMPEGMRVIAQLLPITYINRDFYMVWKGDSYNFVPMLQSFLFWGAGTGILLFIVLKKTSRKRHGVEL